MIAFVLPLRPDRTEVCPKPRRPLGRTRRLERRRDYVHFLLLRAVLAFLSVRVHVLLANHQRAERLERDIIRLPTFGRRSGELLGPISRVRGCKQARMSPPAESRVRWCANWQGERRACTFFGDHAWAYGMGRHTDSFIVLVVDCDIRPFAEHSESVEVIVSRRGRHDRRRSDIKMTESLAKGRPGQVFQCCSPAAKMSEKLARESRLKTEGPIRVLFQAVGFLGFVHTFG